MTEVLERLNALPQGEVEEELLKCCGSTLWARHMAEVRPFRDIEDLFARADSEWLALDEEDWLEAFSRHPRIGEKKAAAPQSADARGWSEQEQSGARDAASETLSALAEGNREYEKKFGFIYIVCATGKSAPEMLALLRERLSNDTETELRNAAEEQRKITRLRLEKLLGKEAGVRTQDSEEKKEGFGFSSES